MLIRTLQNVWSKGALQLSLVWTLGTIGALSGCGGSAQRTLLLLPPVSEPCDSMANPGCQPVYDNCDTLNLKTLSIEVGLFHRQTTTIACPADLGGGAAQVTVSYQPGEDFYMVDANYTRNMEKQNLTAGPFLEADAEWRLLLK